MYRVHQGSKVPGLKALGWYQLGVSYAMMFHDDKALSAMKQTLKYVRKGYAHDEFAYRRAKQFIKAGSLSDFQRKFLRVRIAHEARQFEVYFFFFFLLLFSLRSLCQGLPALSLSLSLSLCVCVCVCFMIH